MSDDEARRLAWPDCRNARDLGGLPTADGATIRPGAVVRSDSLARLTPAGIDAVRDYGVSRIVDLRSVSEVEARPNPFVDDPIYQLLPLIDPRAELTRDPAAENTLAATYTASLTRNAGHIVAGVAAIADAPSGCVLVHCSAGKDRTGMTVALALRIAGVPDDVIADDYAYTAVCLGALFEAELARTPAGSARRRLREQQSSNPQTIIHMLKHLDDGYGGAEPYLRSHGCTEAQIGRLRDRLVDR